MCEHNRFDKWYVCVLFLMRNGECIYNMYIFISYRKNSHELVADTDYIQWMQSMQCHDISGGSRSDAYVSSSDVRKIHALSSILYVPHLHKADWWRHTVTWQETKNFCHECEQLCIASPPRSSDTILCYTEAPSIQVMTYMKCYHKLILIKLMNYLFNLTQLLYTRHADVYVGCFCERARCVVCSLVCIYDIFYVKYVTEFVCSIPKNHRC